MQIYLPIAEMSVHIAVILGLGVITGILSGLFGVGGGFITTPFLMFIGIPPAVAVSSAANQIVAAAYSGFLAHNRKNNVDFRMGGLLLLGGFVGSLLGIFLFQWLKEKGQIDLVISLLYITLLGSIGLLMLRESRSSAPKTVSTLDATWKIWREKLPWKMHFEKSDLTVSAWLPVMIGISSGIMVAILGVGGGFFMIPAMIYLVGMPTSAVVGTSLFQVMFITAFVTFLQSITTQTVDIVLATFLILGSVVGAQLGTRLAVRVPAERVRQWMSYLILIIVLRLLYGLFASPADVYTVSVSDF